jgi:hypothetical protein
MTECRIFDGMLCHAQVIAAFGGTAGLARAIAVNPKLAVHWGRRGIPAKYWPRIEETEVGQRLGITASRLMRLPVTCELEAA